MYAITFIPVNELHVPLMLEWLNNGEAFRWYGCRPTTEAAIRQKYLIERPKAGTRCFIIQQNQQPIGYLQCYCISNYPDYCALVGAESQDYGLDLFIGRDDLIGRGIGTEVVVSALRELIFAQVDVRRCIVGPSPDNKRAIRCYEKCGFHYVRTILTPDGQYEHIMAIERQTELSKQRPVCGQKAASG
jgi:RimJ/RimL family protein N-acetyltransferase